MIRIKAIDTFRGLCIFYMTFGHMIYWGIILSDFWLYEFIWNFGAFIGGGGFLLVSGMSAVLSYRRRLIKVQSSKEVSVKIVRNEYMFRALIIFAISIFWNFFGTLYMGLPGVWLWFVLQTISISLMMAWPFFKTSKLFRLFICFACWIGNEIIFAVLSPHQGQQSVLGFLFFLLYNVPEQNVILGYFPFLLAGTIIGDLFFEASLRENLNHQKTFLKEKLFKPGILGGILLIIFGVFYKFPDFANKETFSSHMFIFGIELLLIIILVIIKDFKKIQFKKKYSVIKYYSFYSFTIFLAHHLLFFIFAPQFNAIEIWLYIIPIMVIWTAFFRFIYKKLGKYASLKFIISKSANYLAEKIELVRSSTDR